MTDRIISFDSPQFQSDLEKLINHEGGWKVTNDPDDPDLATFAGVRYISYVRWCKKNNKIPLQLAGFIQAGKNESTLATNRELRITVTHIYYDDYYTPSGAIHLKFEPTIRYMIFSAAVNHNYPPVVKMIQRVINAEHKNILTIDGQLGPRTLKIFKQYLLNNEEEEFIIDFMHQWLLYYAGIVQRNADKWRDYAEELENYVNKVALKQIMQRKPLRKYKFLKGWINRVFKAL